MVGINRNLNDCVDAHVIAASSMDDDDEARQTLPV